MDVIVNGPRRQAAQGTAARPVHRRRKTAANSASHPSTISTSRKSRRPAPAATAAPLVVPLGGVAQPESGPPAGARPAPDGAVFRHELAAAAGPGARNRRGPPLRARADEPGGPGRRGDLRHQLQVADRFHERSRPARPRHQRAATGQRVRPGGTGRRHIRRRRNGLFARIPAPRLPPMKPNSTSSTRIASWPRCNRWRTCCATFPARSPSCNSPAASPRPAKRTARSCARPPMPPIAPTSRSTTVDSRGLLAEAPGGNASVGQPGRHRRVHRRGGIPAERCAR